MMPQDHWTIYFCIITVIGSFTDSSNIFFDKTNETINLDYMVTVVHKERIGHYDPNTFSMLPEKSGCPSVKATIFIFDKDMTFEYMPLSQPLIVGDNVTLSCHGTFHSSVNVISTEMKIYDSSGFIFNVTNDVVFNRAFDEEMTASVNLETNGTRTYYCSWTYSIKGNYKDSIIRNVSLRVYMSPKNVRPDKEIVKVNRFVKCISDSDPPAEYSWKCSNDSWASRGASVVYLEAGDFNCTCVAYSIIAGQQHRSQWNGIIKVMKKGRLNKADIRQRSRIALFVCLLILWILCKQ